MSNNCQYAFSQRVNRWDVYFKTFAVWIWILQWGWLYLFVLKKSLVFHYAWLSQFLFLVITSPTLEKKPLLCSAGESRGVYKQNIQNMQAWFVYLYLSLDDTIERVLLLYPGCLAYNKCFTLEWKKQTNTPKQQKLKRTTCDLCVFIYWEKVLLYRGKPFSF